MRTPRNPAARHGQAQAQTYCFEDHSPTPPEVVGSRIFIINSCLAWSTPSTLSVLRGLWSCRIASQQGRARIGEAKSQAAKMTDEAVPSVRSCTVMLIYGTRSSREGQASVTNYLLVAVPDAFSRLQRRPRPYSAGGGHDMQNLAHHGRHIGVLLRQGSIMEVAWRSVGVAWDGIGWDGTDLVAHTISNFSFPIPEKNNPQQVCLPPAHVHGHAAIRFVLLRYALLL